MSVEMTRHSSMAFIQSLRMDGLGFTYGEGAAVAFDNVCFEIPLGKNILVTGPAGNGQSTFLKLLAVLMQPQTGSYYINGHDTAQMSFEEFLPFRRKIGYTFDFGGLFANRTLLENLTLGLLYHRLMTPDEADASCRRLAETFSFVKQLDQRPAAVSGGLRKLVCVLRAILLGPEMLVMDDPFGGLDPESSRKLIELIAMQRESGGLCHLFFTSRDEVWPSRLGHEALIIENGKPRDMTQRAG